VAQRLHRPALDEVNARCAVVPGGEPAPRELRTPAEPARQRRKRQFEHFAWPALRADVIDQDDLATWLHDARELVERRLRVRHRRDDELRHDDVEEIIRKCQMLGIHHGQCLDIGQAVLGHTFLRLAQHWRRDIDPDQAVGPRVVGECDTGSDADLQHRIARLKSHALDRAGDVPNCGVTFYEFDQNQGTKGKLALRMANFVAPLLEDGTPVTSAPDVPAAPKS